MILETLDGIQHRLSDYGLNLLTFTIESLSLQNETEIIDGRDGHIDIDTRFVGRSMRASFFMESDTAMDYYLKRNDVYRLFGSRQYFYLMDPKEPKRRWKVKTSATFTPVKINSIASKLDVEFLSPSPYAESVSSTLNPDDNFQVSADGPVQYTFSENTFSVWNDGDVVVDPRESDLVIVFTGASNGLTITNLTTRESFQYFGTTIEGDSLVLESIRCLKNGNSVFKNCSRTLLTIQPQWNDFLIEGTMGPFTISFDFRFKYI
jgi:hypothetical protein